MYGHPSRRQIDEWARPHRERRRNRLYLAAAGLALLGYVAAVAWGYAAAWAMV